jgi:hypothetical protein
VTGNLKNFAKFLGTKQGPGDPQFMYVLLHQVVTFFFESIKHLAGSAVLTLAFRWEARLG